MYETRQLIFIGLTAILLAGVACGEKRENLPRTETVVKKTTPDPNVIDLDTPLRLVGKVTQMSKVPSPESLDYDDLLTTVKLAVEKVEKGTYGDKTILVQLLAIRDRQALPASALKPGRRLRLYLVPWADTAESLKSLQQVDDVGDFELTPYFAAAHVDLDAKPLNEKERNRLVKSERAKAVEKTRAALQAELEKYGDGSYDAWLERLSPFYEDIKRQGEAITKETARKGEYGPFKKHRLSVYKSLYAELMSLPVEEHPALPQIVGFKKALEARGIDLIYVSLPRPHLVYADYIADISLPHLMVAPRYRQQLKYLVDHDVEVVDTMPFILEHREEPMGRMYTETSHHPTNAFMRRFAEMVATRIERHHLVDGRYEVLVSEPASPDHGTEVRRVVTPDGAPYKDARRSPVLVIGDSTVRINWPSPNTGFTAHLSRLLGLRTSLVQRNSFGLSTLAKEPSSLLDGVRVVVWVQWSLFLGKPYARDNWWKRPVDWTKTHILGQ